MSSGHTAKRSEVEDVHDVHVWTVTGWMNVVSVRVVLVGSATPMDMPDRLTGCPSDVERITLQLEPSDQGRIGQTAHG